MTSSILPFLTARDGLSNSVASSIYLPFNTTYFYGRDAGELCHCRCFCTVVDAEELIIQVERADTWSDKIKHRRPFQGLSHSHNLSNLGCTCGALKNVMLDWLSSFATRSASKFKFTECLKHIWAAGLLVTFCCRVCNCDTGTRENKAEVVEILNFQNGRRRFRSCPWLCLPPEYLWHKTSALLQLQ